MILSLGHPTRRKTATSQRKQSRMNAQTIVYCDGRLVQTCSNSQIEYTTPILHYLITYSIPMESLWSECVQLTSYYLYNSARCQLWEKWSETNSTWDNFCTCTFVSCGSFSREITQDDERETKLKLQQHAVQNCKQPRSSQAAFTVTVNVPVVGPVTYSKAQQLS